jgi:hypothetical protein
VHFTDVCYAPTILKKYIMHAPLHNTSFYEFYEHACTVPTTISSIVPRTIIFPSIQCKSAKSEERPGEGGNGSLGLCSK